MADARISQLSAAASVAGTDQIAVNQSGTTRRATLTQVSAFVSGATPVGGMMMWGTNSAPSGWQLCYGQAISRTTYAALFAVIGTTFGAGNGSTTFNVPDLRGRLPLGQDDMGGSSANRVTAAAADTIGGTGGAETVTLTSNEMPAHTHNSPSSSTFFTQRTGAGAFNVSTGGGTNDILASATASAGGGAAHDNMPPYVTLNYIIYAGA